MEPAKEQKSNEEIVQAVDVELNEEQLEIVAGGAGDPLKRIKDFIGDIIDVINPK
ncbi:hypothetical protein [Arcicella rosea]|uniref:Uncharacterized protein n=1 Tax=Arcicella rosea TaxID=502909 RepID=A0A841EGN2_9BACT|nr:hypothetical protein [Arcicella rosea]MBB6002522.1 hypothetical protein [Arcicella rosea]